MLFLSGLTTVYFDIAVQIMWITLYIVSVSLQLLQYVPLRTQCRKISDYICKSQLVFPMC